MQHLDEGTIHAWIDGALSDDEGQAIETHLASCAQCSAMVAEARGLVAASSRIVSALDTTPGGVIPAFGGRKPAPRRRLTIIGSAIAATLVFAVGTMLIHNGKGNENRNGIDVGDGRSPAITDTTAHAVRTPSPAVGRMQVEPANAIVNPSSTPKTPTTTRPIAQSNTPPHTAGTSIPAASERASRQVSQLATQPAATSGFDKTATTGAALGATIAEEARLADSITRTRVPAPAPAPPLPRAQAQAPVPASLPVVGQDSTRPGQPQPTLGEVVTTNAKAMGGSAGRDTSARAMGARRNATINRPMAANLTSTSLRGCYEVNESTDVLPKRFALVSFPMPQVRYVDSTGQLDGRIPDVTWTESNGRAVIQTVARGEILELIRGGASIEAHSTIGERTARSISCK